LLIEQRISDFRTRKRPQLAQGCPAIPLVGHDVGGEVVRQSGRVVLHELDRRCPHRDFAIREMQNQPWGTAAAVVAGDRYAFDRGGKGAPQHEMNT